MSEARTPSRLVGRRPSGWVGAAVSVISVAAATAAIYPLKDLAPTVSLSVVYLPAVLLVSAYWGLALGVATSLLSAAAFNFFHLPPTGRFTIADSRNWVALGAFIIVAVVVSTVAELARNRAIEAERRRAQADLAAALARDLLAEAQTEDGLAAAARHVAEALAIAVRPRSCSARPAGDRRRRALPLSDADRDQIATLIVPSDLPADDRGAGRNPRRPGARGDRRDRAASRRRAGGGRGDRGAPPQRRRQDRAAASGLARSAHAADGDRRRRPRARRRRRSRAEERDRAQPCRDRARASGWRRSSRSCSTSRSCKPAAPSRGAIGSRWRTCCSPRSEGVARGRRRDPGGDRARSCRTSGPTPPSSSARSRTCSKTRSATPAAIPCPSPPAARDTRLLVGSSTRGQGSSRPSASGSSSRSIVARPPARTIGPDRAWAWRSRRALSRPTAGRSRWSPCPGQGTTFVVALPLERRAREGGSA